MPSRMSQVETNYRLYLFAAFASLALSCWISLQQTVINPDAICYLYAAEEFGKTGLHGAMHLCPQAIWPFYSMLIYGLVKITTLPYTIAAFAIDAIFSAISVLLFISIIKELGGSRRVMWFAAIVVLLAHEFNSVRQYIIRDHGYWVCYLASFWALLRYFNQPSYARALLWSAVLLAGTLFRIEGAVFLLVLPFATFFFGSVTVKKRFCYFLQLNTLILILLGVAGVWSIFHPEIMMAKLGRVGEVPNQLQNGMSMMWATYTSTQNAITQTVLSHAAVRDATIVVFLTLILWYLVNVVNNLSWIFTLLVGFAWITRAARFTSSAKLVIFAYLVVNFAVTAGFFAENLFLAKRYLIAFSLILMLWVPFALEKLWNYRSKIFFYLATLLIFISSLGSFIHFGSDKNYIRQAGDWLSEHVAKNESIYANDYQIMYYSHHFDTDIFTKIHDYMKIDALAKGGWQQYDYVVLMVSKDHHDKAGLIAQEIHIQPVKVFVNNKGTSIYIYKIPHEGKK